MHRFVRLLRAGFDRLFGLRCRASRHDFVLAVIPAAFLVAAMLASALPVNLTAAVAAAAVVSGLAVLDALFFNPPRDPAAGRPPA